MITFQMGRAVGSTRAQMVLIRLYWLIVKNQGTRPTFKIIPNTNSHISTLRMRNSLASRESGNAVRMARKKLSGRPAGRAQSKPESAPEAGILGDVGVGIQIESDRHRLTSPPLTAALLLRETARVLNNGSSVLKPRSSRKTTISQSMILSVKLLIRTCKPPKRSVIGKLFGCQVGNPDQDQRDHRFEQARRPCPGCIAPGSGPPGKHRCR